MIRLRFFGTGGLGAIRVKNKLSKDYRRFSTLLIDEKIIIDPSEDIFEFVESFMLSGILSDVKDVFITHSHLDHFSISTIEKLAEKTAIRVYASEVIKNELSDIKNVDFIPLSPFSLIKIDKYAVLPLPANHRTEISGECALNFLIECEGKTVLYALDGAFINSDAWQILKEVKLEAVILDFALGISDFCGECANHNNLQMAKIIKQIFISSSVATENTKFILSHVPSGRKAPTHDEICEKLDGTSFKLAYDGYFLGI